MPAKNPSSKTVKNLFKLISLDLVDKVKAEIAGGIDPNVDFDEYGSGSKTALMHAVGGGRWNSARALLDAGADPKKSGTRGDTVLHSIDDVTWAAELIDKGADVNAKMTKVGLTPLHYAAQSKKIAIAKLLIERGADVHAADHEGKTPYAMSHSLEVRELLKAHGAKRFGKGGKVLTPKKSSATAKDVDASRGAIGIDREGRLWVGGYSGIFVVDGNGIARYEFDESFAVGAIGPGPEGVVYISTNWGLIAFANDTFTLYSSENSELFDNHITEMRTGPDGTVYMLSYESEAKEKHISVFDGEAFRVMSPGVDFPSGLQLNGFAFDARGDLMLAFRGGIAFRENGKWVEERKFGQPSIFPPNVYDIAVDGDRWWVGTQSGVFEKRNSAWKQHKLSSLAKALCVDDGGVWVGVSYGGVARIDDVVGAVFNEENSALTSDDVEALVRAPDGRVWIQAGQEPSFIRNGIIERLTGAKAITKEVKVAAEEKKERKRKLVPFPKTPICPTKKLPKNVLALLQKTKLEGVSHADLLKMIRPAIAFDVEKATKIPIGASKFGGKPDLPASLAWPSFDDDEDKMMPFIMQVNLREATKLDREGLLPKTGLLYFFSDTSPDEISDLKVLYADDKKLVRREFPEDLVDRKKEADFVAQLPELKMNLFEIFTLPSYELINRRARATDDDHRALDDLREKLVELGNKKLSTECSRLLGWPDSRQDEIVDDEKQIALLQLNGWELSPKPLRKIFEHWCSDGLIHAVIKHDALKKKAFGKVTGGMAYT